MKNIYQSRAVAAPPELPSTAVEGYPSNGSSTGGQLATVPGAYWYYMINEELMNAIIGGGVNPEPTKLNQLDLAIKNQLQKLSEAMEQKMANLSTQLAQQGIPTGFICAAGAVGSYDFWLPCDGKAVSRTSYAKLFSVIGTTYGAGDGATTFNVPDLRGEFLRGLDQGRGVDSGRTVGSRQGDAMRNLKGVHGGHAFKYGDPNKVSGPFKFENVTNGGAGATTNCSVYEMTFDASRQVPTANEFRPRNVAVPYYIHI